MSLVGLKSTLDIEDVIISVRDKGTKMLLRDGVRDRESSVVPTFSNK